MWQPNAKTRSMSVGIPTLILAIIAKRCHKQANKRFWGRVIRVMLRSIIDKNIQQPHTVRNHMRYFTSATLWSPHCADS